MQKILAIHHQEDQLAGLVKTLKDLFPGSTSLTARTDWESLEVAGSEQPDVIVLYNGLPEIDGNAVCKKLKSLELTKHIPIIMLPAADAAETGGESDNDSAAYADIFLSRPVNPREFQSHINTLLRLKETEDKLRHSQKVEAISRLAGGIAHDFNNTLAIIRGYTELSLDEVREGSTLSHNLRHVLDASDRAKDLVNQILAFSLQSEDERQAIQLSQIVEESLRVIKSSLPGSIQIHMQIDDEAGMVMADPTRIRQVMMNLYANAAYAMQETGGVLDVRLEKVVLGAKNMNGFKDIAPGSYLKLTVKDTGRGMSQDAAGRIFDPYFTTKAAGEGTGIGISVIPEIVKKHGGDIQVESEPGKGTAFHLYLPCAEQEPEEDAVPAQPIPGGKERILFVDDEQVLVYMQQEVLERLGYDVVAVSNSSEALEIFNDDPEIFDLVITDQSMPGLTGIRLSTELLRIRPDIPIILCTGFSETITREIALKAGVKEFIMKPLIKREIAAVIRHVLENQIKKNNSEEEE
jgi:signal transduction histidine kinase/ActR/RegA family two-component response regulator